MKNRIGPLVVVTLLASLLLVPSALAGSGMREFTAWEVSCTVLSPGEIRVTGDIVHVRDSIGVAQIIGSTAPLMSGTDTVHASYNLNLTNGHGGVHGTATIQPEGVDGTWEFHFGGSLHNFLFSTHTVGRGTGDLAGQIMMLDIQQVAPGALEDAGFVNPCPGAPVYAISGRILEPGQRLGKVRQ